MLLKKIIRVILKVLNDPEINALIRSFLQSLSDEEKKEVKTELDTKSAKEVTAELLNDDEDDVVDEIEESDNFEAR